MVAVAEGLPFGWELPCLVVQWVQSENCTQFRIGISPFRATGQLYTLSILAEIVCSHPVRIALWNS